VIRLILFAAVREKAGLIVLVKGILIFYAYYGCRINRQTAAQSCCASCAAC